MPSPVDPNSNSISVARPPPSTIAIATKRLEDALGNGNIPQATEAAKALLNEGQLSLAQAALTDVNPLPVVKALTDAFSSFTIPFADPQDRYLFAKVLRLFSELTLLRSHDPKCALSLKDHRQPIIEKLNHPITTAEKNDLPELYYALICAQEACKRWKVDQQQIALHYEQLFGIIVGAAISGATQTPSPFVIRDIIALATELYQERKGKWYDYVFLIGFAKEPPYDREVLDEVHPLIGKVYTERFLGRRSKVLLGVIETLAEFIWKGSVTAQRRALVGHDHNPGLIELASVAPFPNDQSKNLWRVHYHAISHLAALKGHTREKTCTRASDALSNLSETRPKVKERLANLPPSMEAYHSTFTVDTQSWGIDVSQETYSSVQRVEKSLQLLSRDTELQRSQLITEVRNALAPTAEVVGPHVLPPLSLGTYVPRESLEQTIQERLLRGEGSITPLTACQGMGGVGKTTLALYTIQSGPILQRYQDRLYWFHRSDDPDQLETQFHQLAVQLNLIDSKASRKKAVTRVLAYFNQLDKPYFIVFDNADSPDALKPYLPSRGGAILVTTRNLTWPDRVEVDILTPDQSLTLIKKFLGEDPDASALAEAMGHHPLGLTQACAYIRADEYLSIAEFLEFLHVKQQHGRILASRPELRGEPLPVSVATLWDITIGNLDDKASALLDQLAYIAPDKIPLPIVHNMGGSKACDTLLEYALIQKRDAKTISIHRLLQMVVRLKRDGEGALRQALATLTTTYTDDPLEQSVRILNWQLVPHGEVLLNHYRALRSSDEGLRKLAAGFFHTMGRNLESLGDFERAKVMFEEALEIDRALYPEKHPNLAAHLNNLGSVLQALGDLEGARQKFEEAVDIARTVLPEKHPNLAIGLNNLGIVLQDLGDLEGARQKLEEALDIDRTTLPEKHPNLATGLNNLGSVLRALGDFEGAKQKLEEALDIDRTALPEKHPKLASHLNNLGSVLQKLWDFEGTRQRLEEALEIARAVYPEKHPNVASHLNNLGNVLLDLGDLEGARQKLEEALDIALNHPSMGPEHPITKVIRKSLSYVSGEDPSE